MYEDCVGDAALGSRGQETIQLEEESFAALLEKNDVAGERLRPGQKVKARVISISGDSVYIDLGGKSEGMIALSEFVDESGAVGVREGEMIEAFFLSVQDGIRQLTTRVRGYSSVRLNAVRDAFEAGIAINGEVKRDIKGGFEVSIGGVPCFCPGSQISLRGSREEGQYVGKTFPFKVLDYKEEGRNIVVSRRALLEQERRSRIEQLKETIAVGMDIKAKVRSFQSFGAFVDLGGVDGLVPISEISWSRIDKPEDVLSIGQEIGVKVLSLDWEKERVTVSIKATQPDPWNNVAEKYAVGEKVSGTIVRLVPFGAFVSVEPAVDGLIHISNLGAGRRINHPKEVVEVGRQVEAYVLAVDPENRKLSLSIQPKREVKKVVLPSQGEVIDGTVDKVMPFGVFVKIGDEVTGLVPNSEMDTPGGSDHSRMFPAGTTMKVAVLEVDNGRGKVLLSRKALKVMEEKEEFKRYQDSLKSEGNTSSALGSLGETCLYTDV
ncbi:MAG: S1 RNA-binding domain-containing protein [Nitrospirae bacterium]|nr:S1 RNA-binding domain-containing protein [Nitrospirota bacterium]